MAKRSRKSRQAASRSGGFQSSSQAAAPPVILTGERLTEFAQEYTYVYYDLRMLLIVTISMIILMVILAYAI